MKVICSILVILISFFDVQAQEISGYFVREGVYSLKDSSYIENNISGNSITVEFFNSKLDSKIIRIGHKSKLGTTYHDYIVAASEIPEKNEDYSIIVANDNFGADIAFKYNNEDFVLLYNYNEQLEKWTGFYAGMLLDSEAMSFLSTKNLDK